ncbi:MAG: cytochrome c peroxidase [Flavobacteriales bacterium]|nr:cytochrome c peroxidase [Flavobacteriales bacterium]
MIAGRKKFIVVAVLFTAIIFSCRKDDPVPPLVTQEMNAPQLPESPFHYGEEIPDFFYTPGLSFFESEPGDNPTTDAGATLGRVLFYDKNLSASKTVACASCHLQEHGFADVTPGSTGHNGGTTGRNASHLVNLRFNFRLFWDLRANGLEEQVLMPIQDQLEMGMTLEGLVAHLNTIEYYPSLFQNAFGESEITSERISMALSQFVRSIISYETKFDEGLQTGFVNFTEQELLGKSLFFNGDTHCNHCHMTYNFYSTQALNNGLESDYIDEGVGALSGDPEDMGKFKVPSLRNVALTSPYMHDGRFATLEEVVEHYNSGVQPHPYLDDRLTEEGTVGGTPFQLNLSVEEKEALIAFLNTITDFELLSDEKFSDPFSQ